MPPKVVILNISPQTNVRTTQNDAKCFRIPDDVLQEKYPDLWKRKKYIMRYNDYKDALLEEAITKKFLLPDHGAKVSFLIPVPKSWTKKKKRAMHFQMHTPRPDIDNLLKALQDTLRRADSTIGHYTGLGKYWINAPQGYIEIVISSQQQSPVFRPAITDEIV